MLRLPKSQFTPRRLIRLRRLASASEVVYNLTRSGCLSAPGFFTCTIRLYPLSPFNESHFYQIQKRRPETSTLTFLRYLFQACLLRNWTGGCQPCALMQNADKVISKCRLYMQPIASYDDKCQNTRGACTPQMTS